MKPESFSPWSVHYRGHTRQTGALWVKCWGYGSLWFLFFFFFKLTFKHSFLLLCSFNQLSKSNTCKPLSFTNIRTCSHFHFQFFQLPSFLFHSQLVFCFFFFPSFPSDLFLNFRGLHSFCAYWAQKPRWVRSPSCYIRATETKKWWRAFWCSDGWGEPGLRGSPKSERGCV